MFSVISVSAKDMRFVQVDSTMFSIYDTTSVQRLENLVSDINKQKNVDKTKQRLSRAQKLQISACRAVWQNQGSL